MAHPLQLRVALLIQPQLHMKAVSLLALLARFNLQRVRLAQVIFLLLVRPLQAQIRWVFILQMPSIPIRATSLFWDKILPAVRVRL